jgi:hypothetical protein
MTETEGYKKRSGISGNPRRPSIVGWLHAARAGGGLIAVKGCESNATRWQK